VRFTEDIEVKQNLHLIARERGKIVARRDGHNIFVDLGRGWLSQLIAYQSYAPDVAQRDDRVRYMGFGIGGVRQLQLTTANSSPIGGPGDPYAASSATGIGANNQTDLNRAVTALERPVRVSGGSTSYPGVSGDKWLGAIQAPAQHASGVSTTFARLFLQTEVSYLPFASVPLSEVGLFTSAADSGFYLNTLIAYDTFDTLSKTTAISLEVSWTFNF
jgi:hypothetical protein